MKRAEHAFWKTLRDARSGIHIDKSPCFYCKYYRGDLRCLAYPDGIPSRFIKQFPFQVHLKKQPDQKGNYVFDADIKTFVKE